jgi:hypothetical protein
VTLLRVTLRYPEPDVEPDVFEHVVMIVTNAAGDGYDIELYGLHSHRIARLTKEQVGCLICDLEVT